MRVRSRDDAQASFLGQGEDVEIDGGCSAEEPDDSGVDDALVRLAATAPEYRGGLSNHGPMVCDSLTQLGLGESVGRWLDAYATRLEEAPPPGRALVGREWADALGHLDRYADFVETIERTLESQPWCDVLVTWVPRFVRGAMGGSTHGLLRTGYAVRMIGVKETAPRRRELARALSYWGACYLPLPGQARPSGGFRAAEALARVPGVPLGARPDDFIGRQAASAAGLPGFAQAVDALREPASIGDALSELTAAMAAWYLGNAVHEPIAFVHGVTAPSVVRLLLPYLPEATQRTAFSCVWHVCAALRAALAVTSEPHTAKQR
jgi:hypothetical protein